ncbi:hypothetical protein [Cryobacterium sp. Y50]|uniref:hypothetical protein n=1 Tax=Cryobacterium sp. Y50 TaxID=2048286 RepID=UPI0035195116
MLIALAPVIDLVLLTTTAVHLHAGADAEWAHSLAVVYIGFSIVYGPRIVRWADIRFSHRFADGPAPTRLRGTDYTVACWKDVARTLLATTISALVLFSLIWLVGNAAQTAALERWYLILITICGIEVIWAVSCTRSGPAPHAERRSRITTTQPTSGRGNPHREESGAEFERPLRPCCRM